MIIERNLLLEIAKELTCWMNGKYVDPKPNWDDLPTPVQRAYLEQAGVAYKVIFDKVIIPMKQEQAQAQVAEMDSDSLQIRKLPYSVDPTFIGSGVQ